MKNTIICLMGPTCSGKTDLAIQLTQKLPCEIISVDSAMIYREMNIGTAKPTADILKVAPHRLIDICDPAESYSAGQFREDAINEIESIIAQNKIPLLVGGTMLYFHALQNGIAELPPANLAIRDRLNNEIKNLGSEYLHNYLKEIDPASAKRIHPNDPQRIQRAIEIYETTGKTLTEFLQNEKSPPLPYQVINFAIAPTDRTLLHKNIAIRFAQMLKNGFIEEVEKLFKRGDLHADLPSIRAVGYRQVWDHLSGKLNYAEMTERGIIATRQLAKRQFTWLRSWENIRWLASEEKSLLDKLEKLLSSQK